MIAKSLKSSDFGIIKIASNKIQLVTAWGLEYFLIARFSYSKNSNLSFLIEKFLDLRLRVHNRIDGEIMIPGSGGSARG